VKRQEYNWSCGAAAIRNAFRTFNHKVSEVEIRKYAETSKRFGTNEYGIIKAIREWEYKATEHRFNSKVEAWDWLHETLQQGHPVILAVENWEHWVTAIGSLGPTGVTVFDPSNWKCSVQENSTHIWDKKTLLFKWWNNRKSVDDEFESRLYAIAVKK